MRVGILECGRPPAGLHVTHGRYTDMFDRLLQETDPTVETLHVDVEHGDMPPSVDACDAYLITGSPAGVYDADPWIDRLLQFIRSCHERRVPMIGICFGHQAIAQALGGTAEKSDRGWGVGVHTYDLLRPAPWMTHPPDTFAAYISHQDQVTKLPPKAERLASSEFCPNAMFRIGHHVFTFQGHPEFTRDFERDLVSNRRDTIGRDRANAALDSLTQPVDSDLLSTWIASFLRHQR